MSTVSNLVQYIGKGVVKGYTTIVPPFAISSRQAVGPGGVPITQAALGDVVRVGLATASSASFDFNYSTGYSGNNGNINFVTATLNMCKYQPLTLTDSEILRLGSPEAALAQGEILGRRLAADVYSASLAQIVTAANFPYSSSYTSTNFTSSMLAPSDLVNNATSRGWPTDDMYMVADATLFTNLVQNPSIVAASNFSFTEQVAVTGRIKSVLGFKPYATSLTLPNSLHGFACTPNAMAITTVYHQPQVAAQKVIDDAFSIVDEQTGATIGYYAYYTPATRTLTRVYDCLAAASVLDPNAFYGIK
jgi:hypothetical protein